MEWWHRQLRKKKQREHRHRKQKRDVVILHSLWGNVGWLENNLGSDITSADIIRTCQHSNLGTIYTADFKSQLFWSIWNNMHLWRCILFKYGLGGLNKSVFYFLSESLG